MSLDLFLSSVCHAGVVAAPRGPDDIDPLRTPWSYYDSWFHFGVGCKRSEQALADGISAARTGGRVCQVTHTGSNGWPVNEHAGSQWDVGKCEPAGFPLPPWGAKPIVRNLTAFHFNEKITPSGDVCPNNMTDHPKSYNVERILYKYCPKGYGIRVLRRADGSTDWRSHFCAPGPTVLERDPDPDPDTGASINGACLNAVGADDRAIINASMVGNPVSIGTGKKTQVELDFLDQRDSRFKLARNYNSILANRYGVAAAMGMFGMNWRSNFERRIEHANSSSTGTTFVKRPNGTIYYFNLVGANWVSNSDIREELVRTATGWEYRTASDLTEIYDSSGRLIRLQYKDGYTQELSYDAQGRLEKVSTRTGEFIGFIYDGNNRVANITDHVGRTWNYRYDANGNLEYVDNPDGTTRQYHYEDASHKYALTGMTDERGVRYANFEYHADGRTRASYHGPQTSVLTDRIDGVSITYNAGVTRTVTNSNNDSTTYTLTPQRGVGLVTGISGPGCSSCGAADTAYRYAPATNNLVSKTGNNITTKYGNYDHKGNYRCMVEGVTAADTSTGECAFDPAISPDARRVDYAYDSRYHGKVKTITGRSVRPGHDRITRYDYDDFGNRTAESIAGYAPDGQGGWTAVSRTTTWKYGGSGSTDCPES
ncbi:MAG: DUF6531 domain-containing protein, partial [Gammaproteobacteria bacterium]